MVCRLECDCKDRIGIQIETMKMFKEVKAFFDIQVNNDIFYEEKNKEPYRVWTDGVRVHYNTATKWYRCKVCGCLWEFEYPDFPAKGFIRKYSNGIYNGTEHINFEKNPH